MTALNCKTEREIFLNNNRIDIVCDQFQKYCNKSPGNSELWLTEKTDLHTYRSSVIINICNKPIKKVNCMKTRLTVSKCNQERMDDNPLVSLVGLNHSNRSQPISIDEDLSRLKSLHSFCDNNISDTNILTCTDAHTCSEDSMSCSTNGFQTDLDCHTNTTTKSDDYSRTILSHQQVTTIPDSYNQNLNDIQVDTGSNIRTINLILQRLPGEQLGMDFTVKSDGTVVVTDVVADSAADRSSDKLGNILPIREKDEIIEINNVSLKDLSISEIHSILHELPLKITLTIHRQVGLNMDKDAILHGLLGFAIPIGYIIQSITLAESDSKRILSSDLKESELDGFYKIQRDFILITSTNSIKRGDIFYTISGELLINKTKLDIISKLNSVDDMIELALLRKTIQNSIGKQNCTSPYYSNVFAQNCIKLAISKYERPSTERITNTACPYKTPNDSQNEIVPLETDQTESDLQTIHKYRLPVKKGNWILCEKLVTDCVDYRGNAVEAYKKIWTQFAACTPRTHEDRVTKQSETNHSQDHLIGHSEAINQTVELLDELIIQIDNEVVQCNRTNTDAKSTICLQNSVDTVETKQQPDRPFNFQINNQTTIPITKNENNPNKLETISNLDPKYCQNTNGTNKCSKLELVLSDLENGEKESSALPTAANCDAFDSFCLNELFDNEPHMDVQIDSRTCFLQEIRNKARGKGQQQTIKSPVAQNKHDRIKTTEKKKPDAENNSEPIDYVGSAFDKQRRLSKPKCNAIKSPASSTKQEKISSQSSTLNEHELSITKSVKDKILFFNQPENAAGNVKWHKDSKTVKLDLNSVKQKKFQKRNDKKDIKPNGLVTDTSIKEKIAYFSAKQPDIRRKSVNKIKFAKFDEVVLKKHNAQLKNHYEDSQQIYDSLRNAYKLKNPPSTGVKFDLSLIEPSIKWSKSKNETNLELKNIFMYSNENKITNIIHKFGRL